MPLARSWLLDASRSGLRFGGYEGAGVDVFYFSAPQKGWSAIPLPALVNDGRNPCGFASDARDQVRQLAIDWPKWHSIMRAYEDGGHAYHSHHADKMRCDPVAIRMLETKFYGSTRLKGKRKWRPGGFCSQDLADKGVRLCAGRGLAWRRVWVVQLHWCINGKKPLPPKGMQICLPACR